MSLLSMPLSIQSPMHRCPPILNLCLMLAQLGPCGWQRGGEHDRRRKDVTDPSSILKCARTSRSGRVSTPTQPPEAQGGNEERRVPPRPTQEPECESIVQPHGQNHHQARGLDSVNPLAGQLHDVLQQRSEGDCPASPADGLRTGARKVHPRSLSEHV